MIHEQRNPVSRLLIHSFLPIIRAVLKWRKATILLALAITVITFYPGSRLGSEFMPPLDEGDLLYMPTTLPGISITAARALIQQTDKIIRSFPEVHHVLGKIGRAETATDPAPLSMIETTIRLRPVVEYEMIPVKRFFSNWPGWLKKPLTWIWPEVKRGKVINEWEKKKVERFFSDWPAWLKWPLTLLWPEERYITVEELVERLDSAIHFPGVTNAWTMPIKTRIDMLSTGIKTPVGIKLMGPDLQTLSDLGEEIEAILNDVPGTLSVYSERVTGGNYMDFKIDRREIARYGLTIGDVQDVIMSAVGGLNVTSTVEGLERYPVNLRYSRELRDDIELLKRVLVHTPTGAQVPLAQLADLSIRKGPPSIKTENARKSAWIYVDLKGVDVGSYVNRAKALVDRGLKFPPGYSLMWSGQYEYMEKARKTLKIVVPLTLVIVFLLLYVHFHNLAESILVMLCLPFSIVGGIWLLFVLGYNMSVAVAVGFIALVGLSAEFGVVMLVYLDEAYHHRRTQNLMCTTGDLHAAVIAGAVDRVRPVMMTVSAALLGLMPIMWGTQTGSTVLKRIAAPMVGGLITAGILTLVILPAIYDSWKRWELRKELVHGPRTDAATENEGEKT